MPKTKEGCSCLVKLIKKNWGSLLLQDDERNQLAGLAMHPLVTRALSL